MQIWETIKDLKPPPRTKLLPRDYKGFDTALLFFISTFHNPQKLVVPKIRLFLTTPQNIP